MGQIFSTQTFSKAVDIEVKKKKQDYAARRGLGSISTDTPLLKVVFKN